MTSSNRTGALLASLALERRLRCEPVALEMAIPRFSSNDIADAERILVDVELKTSARARVETAFHFYMRLMLRCDDAALATKVLNAQTAVLNNASDHALIRLEGERVQHQRWCLLEYCRRGDVDRAVNALRKSIEENLSSLLTSHGEPIPKTSSA